MISSEHTQSLTTFRSKISETLDRINQTGEAEIITVNGQARGVILAPAVYDELARESQLSRDVATIRRSMEEIEQGNFKEAGEFFDSLRTKLLAMKASRDSGLVK